MKRNTWIWAVLWILSLVLISFHGGPVAYSMFFLLTVIPLVSLIYLIYIYFFFHMYQKVDSKWLVVDETSPFYFTLVNDYYILFAGVRVQFYSDFSSIDGLDEQTEYEFFPTKGITLQTGLTCKCRGEYEVGINRVIIQDYFRLFTLSYKNKEPLKVVVRPKLVKLESVSGVDVSFSSRDTVASEFESDVLTRAYIPGDDLRQIHWGLSAKTGELMIRKRTGNEHRGVGILLLAKRINENPSIYLPVENKMLETALALTMFFAQKGISISHYHKGSTFVSKTVTGIEQFNGYYDLVSDTVFDINCDLNSFLYDIAGDERLLLSKTVFLICSEYCTSMEEVFKNFVRHNVDVMIYFIGYSLPAELINLNMSRIQVTLIAPDADLREVM